MARYGHGALTLMIAVPLACAALAYAMLRFLTAVEAGELSEPVRRFRALPAHTQTAVISVYEESVRDPYTGRRLARRAEDFLKRSDAERAQLERIDEELRRLISTQTEAQRAATLALSPSARGVVLIRTLERESPERFAALKQALPR